MKIIWNLALVASIAAAAGCAAPVESDAAGEQTGATSQALGGAQCPTGPEIHACDLNCIAEHLGESCIQSCTWCAPGGLESTPVEAKVEAPKPETSGPCLTPQELADCDAHCREAKEGASCYLACATCY